MSSELIRFLATRLHAPSASCFKKEMKTFHSWYNFSRELTVLLLQLQITSGLQRLKNKKTTYF